VDAIADAQRSAFLAHLEKGGDFQPLCAHLTAVSDGAGYFSAKIGLKTAGALIGLVHDLGKYSTEFQEYLRSESGERGRIDHSSAGAQTIWQRLVHRGKVESVVAEILALCVASHHSGLIDCVAPDGADKLSQRMLKAGSQTHYDEVWTRVEKPIADRCDQLIREPDLIACVQRSIVGICNREPSENTRRFAIALLVRFLFSCLIDADRIDTANSMNGPSAAVRQTGRYTAWTTLVARLENRLGAFPRDSRINDLRHEISAHCLRASGRSKGVFTLTVPTGGGKTLASLRFALNHAARWKMDRIIYVIPYTSIIDQNAEETRRILEPGGAERGSIVLEHHSNLTPAAQTWRNKMLSENWDAPVVFTTSVQLLETFFGSGTRGARRMHQLANAVLIFDEVQTLPIRCVHLFNNAMNFLREQCGSTIVLCTATQPLLHSVDSMKGAIRLAADAELMPDVQGLFLELKRCEVLDCRKPVGWSHTQAAQLAVSEMRASGSCLVVVNTKSAARSLFRLCEAAAADVRVYHLSANMCPAHRKNKFRAICDHLDRGIPVICVSTQLIEAGVDIDFGSVVRCMAGLDSIAQAAGRCNRHGKREMGRVRIINLAEEPLRSLKDIRAGQEAANRVLDEVRSSGESSEVRLDVPDLIRRYFQYYFFDRAQDMDYPVDAGCAERDDTLLNMLGENALAVEELKRRNGAPPSIYLRQCFMTATEAFQAIDAPSQGVIVPYSNEGKELIVRLCSCPEVKKEFKLLRLAQQYTVNVFPNARRDLEEERALNEVQGDTGILYVDGRFYSEEFGLSDTATGEMEFLNA
jgi:CRISPR-associated endonuclease/helicase Cas3